MSELRELRVAELAELTAEDLQSMSHVLLKDGENLTEEHVTALRLRIEGINKSRPVEPQALHEKLGLLERCSPNGERHHSDTPSRSSLSTTPDTIDFAALQRYEEEAYHALVRDGGRPSHPYDKLGVGIVDEAGEYADIVSYWSYPGHDGTVIIRRQLAHWEAFREYQDRMRAMYSPKAFEKYVKYVRRYRQEKGLEGDVYLLQDRTKQSTLDDWKEFQFHEYRRVDGFQREMDKAEEKAKAAEIDLQAAMAASAPPHKINWKEQGVEFYRAQVGGSMIDLEKHSVLLKWIDQQLPIVASECTPPVHPKTEGDDGSPSVNSRSRKRKRSMDDTTERPATFRKVSGSHHGTESYPTPIDDNDIAFPGATADGRETALVKPE